MSPSILEVTAELTSDGARDGLEFGVYKGVGYMHAVETLEDFERWLKRVVDDERANWNREGRKDVEK